HQPIQPIKVGRPPNLERLDAEVLKREPMFPKCSLKCEDADADGSTSHAWRGPPPDGGWTFRCHASARPTPVTLRAPRLDRCRRSPLERMPGRSLPDPRT